jgi:hypothetical protein
MNVILAAHRTVARPEDFAQGFQRHMFGSVGIHLADELREGGVDARRLVDGELFSNRQMQGKMQEGIHRSLLWRPFLFMRLWMGQ